MNNCVKMLAADVEVAINTGAIPQDVSAGAVELDVSLRLVAALYLFVQGNAAGCAGDVDFYLQRSPDGATWFDLDTITVAMNGTSQVTAAGTHADLDLRTTRYLRLGKVGNHEAVAGRTVDVNAYLEWPKYGGD